MSDFFLMYFMALTEAVQKTQNLESAWAYAAGSGCMETTSREEMQYTISLGPSLYAVSLASLQLWNS